MNARQLVKFALVTACACTLLSLAQAGNLVMQNYYSEAGAHEACGDRKGTQQVKGKVPIGGGAGGPNIENVEIEFNLEHCGTSDRPEVEPRPTVKQCKFTSANANPNPVVCSTGAFSVHPEFMFQAKSDREAQKYKLCCWEHWGCYLRKGTGSGICESRK